MILFQRLGWETRVPLVLRECFDVVQVGYDIFKNFDWANSIIFTNSINSLGMN